MNCKQLIEFIADYLEENLPQAQRDEFEKHLRTCPYCAEYLSSYRSTVELAATLRDDPATPADAPEELIRAIVAARKKRAE